MSGDRINGAIIEFPIVRGNLACVEGEIRQQDKPASFAVGRTRQRRRKRYMRVYVPAALSVLIIAGLLAAFMPWSGAERKTDPATHSPPTTTGGIPYTSSGTSLPATIPIAEEAPEYIPDAAEVEALAKLIFGEAGVVHSTTQQAAVAWCVLNRVDDPRFPDTVLEVITAPSQFAGYNADNPVYEEYEALAADVLKRYHAERDGKADAGRVIPADYCFFTGDGRNNHFTIEWKSADTWGWTLSSPYDD